MPSWFKSDKEQDQRRTLAGVAAALVASQAANPAYLYVTDSLGMLNSAPTELEIPDIVLSPQKYPQLMGNRYHDNDPSLARRANSPAIERLRAAVGAPSTVNTYMDHSVYSSNGPFYMPAHGWKDPYVHLNSKVPAYDILAHEFGHATQGNPGLLGKLRRNAHRYSTRMGLLGPFAGIGAAAFIDPESNAQVGGLLAAQALVSAPQLAEEGYASVRALRGLKKLRDAGVLSDAAIDLSRKRLLKSFGAYGSIAAGGLLGTGALLAVRRGAADDTLGL